MLLASGHEVTEAAHVRVLLAGLPVEYDAMVTTASLSPVPLQLDRLIDAMLEIESRQKQLVLETLIQENEVQVEAIDSDLESTPKDAVSRGGRFLACRRGRSMKLKV